VQKDFTDGWFRSVDRSFLEQSTSIVSNDAYFAQDNEKDNYSRAYSPLSDNVFLMMMDKFTQARVHQQDNMHEDEDCGARQRGQSVRMFGWDFWPTVDMAVRSFGDSNEKK
jgi:hypothetical protein